MTAKKALFFCYRRSIESERGFSLLLLLFVGLLILGATGIFFYSQKLPTQQASPQKSVESTPITSVKMLETQDWETYVNDKGGFSLKHPKNWSMQTDQIGENLAANCNVNDLCAQNLKSISFTVSENKNELSLIEYIDNEYMQQAIPSKARRYVAESEKLGLTEEWVINRNISQGEDGYVSGGKKAYIKNGDQVLSLLCLNCEDEFMNAVLSTVKFIDKSLKQAFYPSKTRYFDPNTKFFEQEKYPEELLALKDSEVIGLSCTPSFSKEYNNQFYLTYNEDLKVTQTLEDPLLLALIQKIEKEKATDASTIFSFCKSDDGRILVDYEKQAGGGGSGNTAYFAYFDSNNLLHDIVSIPNPGIPFFGCMRMLALSQAGSLYVRCGGGDGPAGSSQINKLDIKSKTVKTIVKCDINPERSSCE